MPAAKYVLQDLVGVGGMGVVHRAAVAGQPGTVAIKQLRPELATEPLMIRRFETELRVGQMLSHPGIARVLDHGDTPGGQPFLVMAWADGEPLGPRIARHGASPVRDALAIVMRVLDALAYAHARGVVHGDVKADNILVAGEGDALQVTLIDWGLARFLAEPAKVATDFVSGTPGYMAPEVLHGEPASIASDLYAVAVVLYELLTGASPFGRGAAAEIVKQQLYGEVEPLTVRAPGLAIPTSLEQAILRALAKEPAERHASAHELAAAIALPDDHTDELPAGFSPTAPTRDWSPRPQTRRRIALGSQPAVNGNEAVATAVEQDDDTAIAAAYLTRASELLAAHRLRESARQLQLAVDTLSLSSDPSTALWPVLLSLAAIHGGLGDRAGARRIAYEARDHALRADAQIGRERADALLRRLAH